MIFEKQHIAEERIANLTPEEAKLLDGEKGFLLAELYKLDEQKAFDDLWPESRFDFSNTQGKVKAYNEFIHYLVTLNFIRNKPAMALLALRTFRKEISRIELNFDNFLKDEKLVYSVDEDILGKVVGESEIETKSNDEFLTALNSQMTNVLFKDSENRADLLIDFLENKLQEFTDTFGMDGTELINSILSGLKKEEEVRLGKPKTKSATAQVVEQTDEEVIDDLDFLDDDIDEVLNLKKLEKELDLDDLNLD